MASRATHSSTPATRPDPAAPSRPATASRRTRAAGLVTLAGVLTLVAACSSSPSAMASMTSEVRQPAATSELPATDPGTEDGVPDLGDLEDELGAQFDDLTEGLDDLSDCAALGLAYGELVVIAFTAQDPGPEIDAVIKEVQDRIPDELQDELRIVADTLTEAGAGGLLDATGALSDPAFAQANEAISNWIGAQCAGG